MKSLFEEFNSWNVDDDFEIKFRILNLGSGWALINQLKTTDRNKNLLVRFTALAYSYDSILLRKKKERHDVKLSICQFLEMELDDYLDDCINNRVKEFQAYITWWLRQSEDRAFAAMATGEDLFYALLETSRDGISKEPLNAKDEKQAEKVMKSFIRNEIIAKAEAYERAMNISQSLESQSSKIEKNYEYLYSTVKKEGINVDSNIGFAERMVLKRKQEKQ